MAEITIRLIDSMGEDTYQVVVNFNGQLPDHEEWLTGAQAAAITMLAAVDLGLQDLQDMEEL